jgi:hypothetical protein
MFYVAFYSSALPLIGFEEKAPLAGLIAMGRAGLEPATLGLKVPCSTN